MAKRWGRRRGMCGRPTPGRSGVAARDGTTPAREVARRSRSCRFSMTSKRHPRRMNRPSQATAADPALPGRWRCPLEGAREARRGWFISGPADENVNLADDMAKGLTMTRTQVLQQLVASKPELANRFGVTGLALFGSVVRDSARADSDVDILVTFDGPATSKRYFGVQFFLEDLLGRRVDLVTDKALRPEL